MSRVIEKTYGQDYDSLFVKCKHENKLYIDNVFKFDDVRPILAAKGWLNARRDVVFLRPQEICQKRYEAGYNDELNTARMYVEGVSRFDINQGGLGDCWFLVALSQVADDTWAFPRVVPSDQTLDKDEGYVGIFRFRFYRFGKWEEIVIDDRLPVLTDTWHLAFVSSESENEFWAPLVEKAYAKFKGGCYSQIEGGWPHEAALDLTGGIPYEYHIDTIPNDQFPSKLIEYHKEHTMIFATIMSDVHGGTHSKEQLEKVGLCEKHAYCITGVLKFENIYLIRIRNPHGIRGLEWNGEWSDVCHTFQKYREKGRFTCPHAVKLDGEYFMSYKDFIKYFEEVQLVIMKPSKSKFDFYEWTASSVALFYLEKEDGSTIAFNLQKPDGKDPEKKKCSVIISLTNNIKNLCLFKAYKWNTSENTWNSILVEEVPMKGLTESINKGVTRFHTSIDTELEEGYYAIKPLHYHGKILKESPLIKAHTKEEFHLRLFIEKNWGSTNNWQNSITLSIQVNFLKKKVDNFLKKKLDNFLKKKLPAGNFNLTAYLIIRKDIVLYTSELKQSTINTIGIYDNCKWEDISITFPDLFTKCRFQVWQEKPDVHTKDIFIGEVEASYGDVIADLPFTLKNRKGKELGIMIMKSVKRFPIKEVLGEKSGPSRSFPYILNN